MIPEKEDILEEKLISKLVFNQYKKVTIKNESELNLNFKQQLENFNKIILTNTEFEEIYNYLIQGTIFEKFEKLHKPYYLKGTNKIIKFLNNKWNNNILQVTNQINMHGKYTNRYDVTILINGLPLVQIELKRGGEPLITAFQQVERYKMHSYKNLFDYIQIFIVSNKTYTRYFSNGLLNEKINHFKWENTNIWADENHNHINSLEDFTNTFLKPNNLIEMITKYIIFDENLEKLIIFRPYQKYSIEKILNQINQNKNGYVWLSYGTGKTLTSYKLSQLLVKKERFKKVIFITNKNLNKFPSEDIAPSSKELIKKLVSDKKEIIITKSFYLFKSIKNENLEKLRNENFVFIYDDINWKNYENNPKLIVEFFKNSLFYGFTGTPYFNDNNNHERTTKSIFNTRLYSYLLTDALNDANLLNIKIEYLDDFTIPKNYEYPSILLESSKRIEQIAEYIKSVHDSKTINKRFNGILILQNNKLIPYYYDLLKNSNLKIATILRFDKNDELINNKHFINYYEDYLLDYNKNYNTNFHTNGKIYIDKLSKQVENDILKRMATGEIDLLIIDKSFLNKPKWFKEGSSINDQNSPILNTLYIDCDLEYDELIKIFSKVNRVYDKTKKEGNVILFRNIEENVNNAFKLLDNTQSEDKNLQPYSFYVNLFNENLINLISLTPTPYSVLDLKRKKDKKKFLDIFNKLLYNLETLRGFLYFNFEHLNIDELTFIEYKSGYDELKLNLKESNYEFLDYNLKLIKKHTIDIDYLLDLIDINSKPKEDKFELDNNTLNKNFIEKQTFKSYQKNHIIDINNEKKETEKLEDYNLIHDLNIIKNKFNNLDCSLILTDYKVGSGKKDIGIKLENILNSFPNISNNFLIIGIKDSGCNKLVKNELFTKKGDIKLDNYFKIIYEKNPLIDIKYTTFNRVDKVKVDNIIIFIHVNPDYGLIDSSKLSKEKNLKRKVENLNRIFTGSSLAENNTFFLIPSYYKKPYIKEIKNISSNFNNIKFNHSIQNESYNNKKDDLESIRNKIKQLKCNMKIFVYNKEQKYTEKKDIILKLEKIITEISYTSRNILFLSYQDYTIKKFLGTNIFSKSGDIEKDHYLQINYMKNPSINIKYSTLGRARNFKENNVIIFIPNYSGYNIRDNYKLSDKKNLKNKVENLKRLYKGLNATNNTAYLLIPDRFYELYREEFKNLIHKSSINSHKNKIGNKKADLEGINLIKNHINKLDCNIKLATYYNEKQCLKSFDKILNDLPKNTDEIRILSLENNIRLLMPKIKKSSINFKYNEISKVNDFTEENIILFLSSNPNYNFQYSSKLTDEENLIKKFTNVNILYNCLSKTKNNAYILIPTYYQTFFIKELNKEIKRI